MEQKQIHWSLAKVFEEAAMGDTEAQFAMGEALWNGMRTGKDLSQAVYWYEQAALGGNVAAQCALAYAYAVGMGTQVCPEKAFWWYKTAAQSNDIRSLRSLAACYAQGFGTERSMKRAYAMMDRALSLQWGAALDRRGFDRQ